MGIKSVKLPELGEGVTEGEVLKIKVKQGEKVEKDQILFEVMTDKASMELPSLLEGQVKSILVSEGDIKQVGDKLLEMEVSGKDAEESVEEKEEPKKPEKKEKRKEPVSSGEKVLAAPATKKLARDLGISLSSLNLKEVKREDLLNFIKKSKSTPSPSFSSSGNLKKEPVRGVKRLMMESMTISKATIPHFTLFEEVDIKSLSLVRAEMKEKLKVEGLRVGWLPFFLKALIPVMKEFPIFNSVYSSETKELIYNEALNFGFAVDSPQGLLVPVLKHAETKSLKQIIKEVAELAEKTRSGNLERESLQGASITITNLGGIGSLGGTPIINPPEMAIIGVYKLYKKLVKKGEGVEERDFLNISVTCDHRFIDGATAARFLKSFASHIEEPSLLLLN